MNINIGTSLFASDLKRKDSVCASTVSNRRMKLNNNEQKKEPAKITSLANKYSYFIIIVILH